VVSQLKSLGYAFVTLDLAGFQSGSLSFALPSDETQPLGKARP